MKKNIFFIHTPYHARVVVDLILNLKSNKNIFIIECSDKNRKSWYLNRLEEYADLIIIVDVIKPQSIGLGPRELMDKSIEKIKRKIDFDDANLFFSDINWPLNNYFFFSSGFKDMKMYIYEDGSANYVSIVKGIADYCRGIVRKVLSTIKLGPRYSMWQGEKVGGDHSRVVCNYLYRPELSMTKGKKEKIDIRNVEGLNIVVVPDNSLIFLEQPHLDEKSYEKIYKEVINIARNKNIENFFIKKHHFSSERISLDNFISNCIDLTTSAPIEDYTFGENCTVVSCSSSALFNLKVIYGDYIDCFAVNFYDFCSSVRIPHKKIIELGNSYMAVGVKGISSN